MLTNNEVFTSALALLHDLRKYFTIHYYNLRHNKFVLTNNEVHDLYNNLRHNKFMLTKNYNTFKWLHSFY